MKQGAKQGGSSVARYVQTPSPWIDLHDALSPHWSSSTLGVQSSTQYLLPDWSCSAHCGAAVTPAGTSVGHAALVHAVGVRNVVVRGSGEVNGNVLFIRDTSDQHRARNELAAKNAEFDDYVSHVSHDLRSPLVSVLGFAGLLRRDYESALDADGLRFLDRIEQAGQTMQALIDSLLEFSRVGQVDDAARPADCSGVLQQVLTEQKKGLDERKVAIHTPSDAPPLDCNRTHAYQIFSNLVSNAITHTGSVAHPEIWIEIDQQPGCHHIRVRDNGPGVAAADRERIFELFTTATAPDESLASTGVGLAIVRKLATQYGGDAWVEGPADGGAEFHVTLSRS